MPNSSLRSRFSSVQLAGLLTVLLAGLPAALSAQTFWTTVLKSGFHQILDLHSMQATVGEVGGAGAESAVTIEFRDASDSVRASIAGRLADGKPVRLRLPAARGGEQLRAIVRITPYLNIAASQPVVTLEDIDTQKLTVVTDDGCALPSVMPTTGGDAEGNCGGFRRDLVPGGQPNPSVP